jgi:hypothetical protein
MRSLIEAHRTTSRSVGSAAHLFALKNLPSFVDILMVFVTLGICYTLRIALHRHSVLGPGWQLLCTVHRRTHRKAVKQWIRHPSGSCSEAFSAAVSVTGPRRKDCSPSSLQCCLETVSIPTNSVRARAVLSANDGYCQTQDSRSVLRQTRGGRCSICSQLLGREVKHLRLGRPQAKLGSDTWQ